MKDTHTLLHLNEGTSQTGIKESKGGYLHTVAFKEKDKLRKEGNK